MCCKAATDKNVYKSTDSFGFLVSPDYNILLGGENFAMAEFMLVNLYLGLLSPYVVTAYPASVADGRAGGAAATAALGRS